MVSPNIRRTVLLLALIAGSALYTSAYHTLDTHFFWKSLGILLPIQVGASLYLLYLYGAGKLTKATPKKFEINRSTDGEEA